MSVSQYFQQLEGEDLDQKISGANEFEEYLQGGGTFTDKEVERYIKDILEILESDSIESSLLKPVLGSLEFFIALEYYRIKSYGGRVLKTCKRLFQIEEEDNNLQGLVVSLMRRFIKVEGASFVLDIVESWFQDENRLLRVGMLECFRTEIELNLDDFPIIKLIPLIVPFLLMDDPELSDISIKIFEEIYSYVGKPIIQELKKILIVDKEGGEEKEKKQEEEDDDDEFGFNKKKKIKIETKETKLLKYLKGRFKRVIPASKMNKLDLNGKKLHAQKEETKKEDPFSSIFSYNTSYSTTTTTTTTSTTTKPETGRKGRSKKRTKKKPRSLSVGKKSTIGRSKKGISSKPNTRKPIKKTTSTQTRKLKPKEERAQISQRPKSKKPIEKPKKTLVLNVNSNGSKDNKEQENLVNLLDLIHQVIGILPTTYFEDRTNIQAIVNKTASALKTNSQELKSKTSQILEDVYQHNKSSLIGIITDLPPKSGSLISTALEDYSSIKIPLKNSTTKATKTKAKSKTKPNPKTNPKPNGNGNKDNAKRAPMRGRRNTIGSGIKAKKKRGKSVGRKPLKINRNNNSTNNEQDFDSIVSSLKSTKKKLPRKGLKKRSTQTIGTKISPFIAPFKQACLTEMDLESQCEKMERLAETAPKSDWEISFPKVIENTFIGLFSKNENISSRISLTLLSLFENQPNCFKKHTKFVIDKFLKYGENADQLTLEETLTYIPQLANLLNSNLALSSLVNHFKKGNENILNFCLIFLKNICSNITKSQLENHMNKLMENFKNLINHKDNKIRRGVVTCIVEFWLIIGPEIEQKYFVDYIKPNAINLIKIFIKQKQKK
ncbi:clip-associated protein [Anaeramoeba flamelloides]|uniref:Clip-associated protein n=1 Tax=Anaeramoeba flamelloides TaxID=1746091 RepID=A0ABQ8XK01_9EUKA|nr:clip-associated protein [Anaeramoeba flamelloides]